MPKIGSLLRRNKVVFAATTSAVNWLDATDAPVLLNGQFAVTNSITSARFYRLRY